MSRWVVSNAGTYHIESGGKVSRCGLKNLTPADNSITPAGAHVCASCVWNSGEVRPVGKQVCSICGVLLGGHRYHLHYELVSE